MPIFGLIALGLAGWESTWWALRRRRRALVYRQAAHDAKFLGKPLVVIGAPDGGVTQGYGCGDLTVDLAGSSCPRSMKLDITKPLPFRDNSVCVLTVCTLEYVQDVRPALKEIMRVSGGHAYFVGVEPWTLTAYLYPGAKRTLPSRFR